MTRTCALVLLFAVGISGCTENAGAPSGKAAGEKRKARGAQPAGPPDAAAAERPPRTCKVVHAFVALCDNANQRIVPVPAALGNGQDPAQNLYWGAMYGVKTFFTRSAHWAALPAARPANKVILDRCVFRSKGPGPATYVVADAYDGAHMRTALLDFFAAAAGAGAAEVRIGGDGGERLQAGGRSDLVCFVGHNGLMDIRLPDVPANTGARNPSCAVVLACKSHDYFAGPLKLAKCRPLITTAGLMAPEAYTLDAVIRSWANGDAPAAVRANAGRAYAAYQKISASAGERLFVAEGD